MVLGGGNSESKATFLGDDDQDDSIEDILIPSDVCQKASVLASPVYGGSMSLRLQTLVLHASCR